MPDLPNLTPAEIERTSAYLRAMARAWVDDARAEDLTQGAWLRLYDGRARGARRLGPFLAGVVRRLARRQGVAETRRTRREELAARAEAQPSAADLAERLEIARKIAEAIGDLPEPQRTALLLRYDEGLSAAEIARRLGLAPGTVRSRLKRGLDALRERLAPGEGERESWAGLIGAWALPPLPAEPLVRVALMANVVKWSVAASCAILVAVGAGLWTKSAQPESLALAPEVEDSQAEGLFPGAKRVERGLIDGGAPESSAAAPSPPPGSRSVHILLSSAHDLAPLTDYLVEIEDSEGAVVRVETDATGTILCTENFAAGPLVLRGIDHERLAELDPYNTEDQSVPLDGSPLQQIQLRVGPTYSLSSRLPAGTKVGDFRVDLTPLGRTGTIGVGHAPLREGSGPWVRFAPGVANMAGLAPWLLAVQSADGYWAGDARVTSREGIYPESVPLVISARGRLSGRFETPEGPLLGRHGWVLLESQTALGYDGEPSRGVGELDRETGTFVIEHLAPGLHTLRLNDERLEAVEQEITILPGRTVEATIHVAKRADLAAIAGYLRFDAPTLFEGGSVRLREAGSPVPRYWDWLEVPGQRSEVEFRFDDVPPGDYVLSVEASGFELIGGEVSVPHGATDLVLPVRFVESVPIVKRMIRVISAADGEPILYPEITLVGEDEITLFSGDEKGLVELEAPDEALELRVNAEGHRPHWETSMQLGEEETIITLEPGWGAHLRARVEGTHGEPVPGLVVTLDGEDAGTTDQDGELHLERLTTPERIGLRSDAWRIIDYYGGGSDMPLDEVHTFGPILYLYLHAVGE